MVGAGGRCVGRREEAELRHRDPLLAHVLAGLTAFVALAGVLAAALVLVPAAHSGGGVLVASMRPSAPRPVEIAADMPGDTDLLLATPAEGRPAALEAALQRLGYETLSTSSLVNAVRVRVPAGAAPSNIARRLADTGLLAAVEPDARVHADRLPNDGMFATQRPYLDVIRAPEAWDEHASAATITIAIVDTGVDITHPDLANRVARNTVELLDTRDDDMNGCIDDLFGCTFVSPAAADPSCNYTLPAPRGGAQDDEGHGTFVAGIAAASGNNGVGVTGVAWDARILPVKVLDCTATGRISDAAAGILYAARSGARVIVLAFGSASDARVLRDAVTEATDRYGALVVASVGNEGAQRVQFPAAYRGVLAVAGSGVVGDNGIIDYRRPAVFSNTGPEVTVFAPALRLIAPVPAAVCGQGWTCIDGPYARASGTSFAAPLAAGAVALVIAADPSLSPTLAVALIRSGAQPIAGGNGLLDVAGALAKGPYALGAPGTANGRLGPPASGPAADPLR